MNDPEFRAKKANDILSILVGMYHSRDVIVTEIQMWLARQLLDVKNYDYDDHVSQSSE
jgi:anaphase-promoting complex subunit 2